MIRRQVRLSRGRASLRLRLLATLGLASLAVVVALYASVRLTAGRAAEASQDAVLMAAAVSIADGMRGDEGGAGAGPAAGDVYPARRDGRRTRILSC